MAEGPPERTPEEIAEIEGSRTLSDAELIKGGAEYKADERGEAKLLVTDEQVEEIYGKFNRDVFQKVKNSAAEFLDDRPFRFIDPKVKASGEEPLFLQGIENLDFKKLGRATSDRIKLAKKEENQSGYRCSYFITYLPMLQWADLRGIDVSNSEDLFRFRSIGWSYNPETNKWRERGVEDLVLPLDWVRETIK